MKIPKPPINEMTMAAFKKHLKDRKRDRRIKKVLAYVFAPLAVGLLMLSFILPHNAETAGNQYQQVETQNNILNMGEQLNGPSRTTEGETISFYTRGTVMMFNMHLEDVTEEMLRADFEKYILQFKLDKAVGYPDSWVTKILSFFQKED